MAGDPFNFSPGMPSGSPDRCQNNGPLGGDRDSTTVTVHSSEIDRLLDAAYQALPLMPEELRERVAELLTPEAMAVIAGVAAIWAGSHFFGVGFVADIVIAGATIIAVGWDAIKALKAYVKYYETAVNACTEDDIQIAARHFADATLTLASAIGWAKLGSWLGKGGARIGRSIKGGYTTAQARRWYRFINSLKFEVPSGKGMLWSKFESPASAEQFAREKGLISLEMILKKNGFDQLYSREFGDKQNELTRRIWRWVSTRYAQSLRGDVIGYVNRAEHYKHINEAANPKLINRHNDPIIVFEIDEISKILLNNSQITKVTLIDIKTGEAFGFRSRELLESLMRLEKRVP